MRDEVVTVVRAQKARDRARAEAKAARDGVLAQLDAGMSIEEAFAAAGVEFEKTEPFSRRRPPSSETGVSFQALSAATQLEPGEVSDLIDLPDSVGLAGLAERTTPTEEDFERDRDLAAQQLLMRKRRLVLDDYMRHLEQAAGLKKEPGFGGVVPEPDTES